MKRIICQYCSREITIDRLADSLADYGFVNLTSEDEEIVAFYCPEEGCGKQVFFMGVLGLSDTIFAEVSSKFPMWFHSTGAGCFQYYAPFPFSMQNRSLMEDFGVYEKECCDEIDLENFIQSGFNKDTFISFNEKKFNIKYENFPNFYLYKYPKKNLKSIFKFEQDAGLSIFPRYLIVETFINDVDKFCKEQILKNEHENIDKSLFVNVVFRTIMPEEIESELRESRFKVNISKIFNFLNLLTPYRVDGEFIDETLLNSFRQSDVIWNNFYNEFVRLNINLQSELFIEQYLELHSKRHFCIDAVNYLISKFRNDIYLGITSRIGEEGKHEVAKLIRKIRQKSPSFTKFITEDIDILLFELEIIGLVKMKNPPNILITGETGTGKNLLAEAMHKASGRKGDFVHVNVPGVPDNLFESELFGHKKGSFTGAILDKVGKFVTANGGTLFLDEIGDLPLHLQVKLLDAIQEKRVTPIGSNATVNLDIMFIFATNKNLAELIDNKKFRGDLYYRIAVFEFNIPPLRERKNDIPLLARHFVKQFARHREVPHFSEVRLSEEGAAYLSKLELDGNARELEKLIIRILSFRVINGRYDHWPISREEIIKSQPQLKSIGAIVGDDDLSQPVGFEHDISKNNSTKPRGKILNKATVEEVLEDLYVNEKGAKYRGLGKRAALELGVDPAYFYRIIKEWNIVYPWKK